MEKTDIYEKNKIKVGENYYYAKEPKKMLCVEVGGITSKFIDYKKNEYQFYNEDIYLTKHI